MFYEWTVEGDQPSKTVLGTRKGGRFAGEGESKARVWYRKIGFSSLRVRTLCFLSKTMARSGAADYCLITVPLHRLPQVKIGAYRIIFPSFVHDSKQVI